MTKQFPLQVAYHEAGHAVAFCRFLHGFHSVHVKSEGEATHTDRRGRKLDDVSGLVEGTSFDWPDKYSKQSDLPIDLRENVFESGLRHMICQMAGPFAEAQYIGHSVFVAVVFGGSNDWGSAMATARFLADDDKQISAQLFQAIEKVTEKFVREKWPVITAVATKLARKGIIAGDDPLFSDIIHTDEPIKRLIQ